MPDWLYYTNNTLWPYLNSWINSVYNNYTTVAQARSSFESAMTTKITTDGYSAHASEIKTAIYGKAGWNSKLSPQLFTWNGSLLASFQNVIQEAIRLNGGKNDKSYAKFSEYVNAHLGGSSFEQIKAKTIFSDYGTGNSKPASGSVPAATDSSGGDTSSGSPTVADPSDGVTRVITMITPGSEEAAEKALANAAKNTVPTYKLKPITKSAVQKPHAHIKAKATKLTSPKINQHIASKTATKKYDEYASVFNDPYTVQNTSADGSDPYGDKNYPRIANKKSTNAVTTRRDGTIVVNTFNEYEYDYYMAYDSDKVQYKNGKWKYVNDDMATLRKSLNLDPSSRTTLYKRYTEKYDRFKMGNPNDRLMRSYAHVFFVRPDCNIYADGSSGAVAAPQMIDTLENLSEFYYAKKHCPELLRQLTQMEAGYNHQFMMYLSNKARTFQIQDEFIRTDTYGQAITGYKIPYGKHNVESRTAGQFSISYIDDRDLHIYNLHKLWIDYISYVYRGKVVPKKMYNIHKIIDYATCVYYILCAEDGESIIFWSKYWGVFPMEGPSSSFSWNLDNGLTVHDPELQISYQYAFKEDFNPLSLIEFNTHTDGDWKYDPIFNPNKLLGGRTWVGAPFIETCNNKNTGNDLPYTFKLRFRPG